MRARAPSSEGSPTSGQVVDVVARAGRRGPWVEPDGASAELAGGAGAAEDRRGGVRAALAGLLSDVVVLPARREDATSKSICDELCAQR